MVTAKEGFCYFNLKPVPISPLEGKRKGMCSEDPICAKINFTRRETKEEELCLQRSIFICLVNTERKVYLFWLNI